VLRRADVKAKAAVTVRRHLPEHVAALGVGLAQFEIPGPYLVGLNRPQQTAAEHANGKDSK
jgi:hypothetical protein